MQLFPILITISAAILGLSIARAFAPQFQLLDQPTSRKQHSGAVPLVGGISIFLGAWFGLLTLSTVLEGLLPQFIATLLMVGIGILDDRTELSVKPRFVAELIAVLVATLGGEMVLNHLGDL